MSKFYKLEIGILLSGTIFSWYNVINNFISFYNLEGTIFKIRDCQIPNPVTEACFYGAVGFLAALTWSIYIYRQPHGQSVRQRLYLAWFLAAGTIFAWFNVAKEFIAYYGTRSGPAVGCSATPITNPFLTPCFTGASIFLFSAILAAIIYFRDVEALKRVQSSSI